MADAGLGSTFPGALELLGKCEDCGGPASVIVCDFFEITGHGKPWREYQLGGFHCFCAEHERGPRIIVLSADQLRLAARV